MIVPQMLLVLILNTVMNAHVIQGPKIIHLTPRTFLVGNVKPWAAAEYGRSIGVIHGFSNALIIPIKLVD